MSTASEPRTCPACGAPIPVEAPQGLCPRCLLLGASLATEAGQAAHPKSLPPLVNEIAAAFPQLEILGLIGQGGMGYVFKARQPKLDRFVALKILPQTLAADPAFAERFAREGRVLARLNHPNIVTIHDFGQADGFFFLLIEFVDGVNLRQAMQSGQIQPDQALAIVPKICDALQFAHNEGILHRDIKPENIMLDARGRVKITDFGIAKLMGNPANQSPLSQSEETPRPGEGREVGLDAASAITETGKVLGTPQDMAPEQIETPGKVDHRADIYSLGVVFYEMLTGELPLGHFAPPSQKSTADPRLDDVVCGTLEKKPERRTQSAGEVKTQVETIATTKASAPTPETLVAGRSPPGSRPDASSALPSSKQSRFRPIFFLLAGALVFLFIVGALVSYILKRSQPPQLPPPQGLVSWWPGEGNAEDSFGTNNGTVVGGAKFAAGMVGQAFDLNGASQYVDVPDSPNLNPSNCVTVEAWIYPRSFSGNAPIVKKAGEDVRTDHGYELEMAGSNGVVFGVYLRYGVGWVITRYAPVPLKEWSHVAGVYDGTNASIYVNGTLIATASAGPGKIAPSGNHLQIGHDPANPERYFNGLIDEPTVYDTALSATEIAAIYDAGGAGKSASPPMIVSQPASVTLFAGQTARFSVSVDGGKPLGYQWLLNGANISPSINPTATNATLVLTNMQHDQSGGFYSVKLKNASGSTISLNAALTVNRVPAGLVSWWQGEGNAADSFGANDGKIGGGVTFAPGLVGQAFNFDGLNGTVTVPDSSDLRMDDQITIEAWINLRSTNGDQGIVSKLGPVNGAGRNPYPIRDAGRDGSSQSGPSRRGMGSAQTNNQSFGGPEGYQFGLTGNQLVGLFNGPGQPWPSYAVMCPLPVALGTWNHVAWTYDQSTMTLYLNGQPIASSEVGPHAIATSSADLRISGAENHVYFNGLMDEVSIYNRALTAAEIQAIYNAGGMGKPPSPPVIARQPVNQNAFPGQSARFSVSATGAQPMRYQWRANGVDIPPSANSTAATPTLVLSNVQSNQMENLYSVVVSNQAGSALSSSASIASIATQPGSVLPPSGMVSWWKAEGNSRDAIGANDGVLINGAAFADGKVGLAFDFNGNGQYIELPDTASLSPTGSFTIEGWSILNPIHSAAYMIMGKWGDIGVDARSYNFNVTPGYGLAFGIADAAHQADGSFQTFSTADNVLSANVWTHVAAVYDRRSGTRTLYVNGMLMGSKTDTPITVLDALIPASIGAQIRNRTMRGAYFDGKIDELSLYDRALSPAEIWDIYNAGSSGKYTGGASPAPH